MFLKTKKNFAKCDKSGHANRLMNFEEQSNAFRRFENRDGGRLRTDLKSQDSRSSRARSRKFPFSQKWSKVALWLSLATMIFIAQGCGTFVANRIAQAPNTYPTWFAPKARVSLGISPKMLNTFPSHYVDAGNPQARLYYRVIEPAKYDLRVATSNWVEHGEQQFDFTFHAKLPGETNQWSAAPRGTVVLLHGYGLAQFSMAPWALRLAEEGWRCVLVDLRGHGKSTGKRIYFGTHETNDLSRLLDKMTAEGQLTGPVAVMGESYGAALALRWATIEPRVSNVVAIAPYGVLSNAVLNISRDYAKWVPLGLIRSGLRHLPSVLNVQPGDLDTTTVLRRNPETALFIAGADDKIAPAAEVEKLSMLAKPGSRFIVVPHATHEAVTYFFKDLAAPVITWLQQTDEPVKHEENKQAKQ
jgi:pimeloyl-ACP methyl ester carboxylesterase